MENLISVSVIDYIGEMNGGVSLLLNVIINEISYEVAYWFNRNGEVRFVPEQKLLDKLNVKSIYEYNKFEELVMVIHSNIPNVDKILDEFNV